MPRAVQRTASTSIDVWFAEEVQLQPPPTQSASDDAESRGGSLSQSPGQRICYDSDSTLSAGRSDSGFTNQACSSRPKHASHTLYCTGQLLLLEGLDFTLERPSTNSIAILYQ